MLKTRHPKPRTASEYRSELEARLVPWLVKSLGGEYEPAKYNYPGRPKRYIPDVCFKGNGVCIELKGYLRPSDRTKLLDARRANPGLDIRLVFQEPANKLNAKSNTRYWQWAEKHGFKWCAADDAPTMRAWANETPP